MFSGTTGRSAAGRPWLPDACARIGMLRAPNADKPCGLRKAKGSAGASESQRETNDRFAYVNASKQFRDPEHVEVFANADAAETWFDENDPEDVAFEYDVLD
jgi:hypothetical protein